MPKFTVLTEIHKELDAKFSPFHGWSLPVNYPGGVLAEHKHTNSYCSIFDASYSGKFRIAGTGCAAFLDNLLMYKASLLEPGKSCRNHLLANNGCFIDTVTVCRMADEDFFITSGAENAAKVCKLFSENLPSGVTCQDLSELIAQIDLLGPASPDVLQEAEAENLPGDNCCGIVEIAEIRCIINKPSDAGCCVYELFCSADNAIDLWDELTCIEPVRPCGTGAKDAVRVEKGILLPEYNAAVTPLDCGLEIPDYDFNGKTALSAAEPSVYFVFVKLDSKQSAHAGTAVALPSGEEIGTVSSSCLSPVYGCACAICRINAAVQTEPGSKVLFLTGSSTPLSGIVCTPEV